MKTNQPRWKMIANLGDVDPIAHGGAFVYVDTTGVYPPELEVLESRGDEDRPTWVLSRVVLENDPEKEWYWDRLINVASWGGTTLGELQQSLRSVEPIDRAQAYQDLIGYFGVFEFDQYPRIISKRRDLPRRIRRPRAMGRYQA